MAGRILIITNADPPSFLGVEMSALIWVLVGVLIALVIGLFGLCIKAQIQNRRVKPIEFQPSKNPLDEGITQRLYKPSGTPAKIHKSAIRRDIRRKDGK